MTLTEKKINKNLFGIFFENINYSADGGLYAGLVQNRSFEYKLFDWDTTWTSKKCWNFVCPKNAKGSFGIDSVAPLNENNPHYAVVTVDDV